jgi:hypothetical protein
MSAPPGHVDFQEFLPGMVVHACSPSTWEAEAGGSRAQPGLCSKGRKKKKRITTGHTVLLGQGTAQVTVTYHGGLDLCYKCVLVQGPLEAGKHTSHGAVV